MAHENMLFVCLSLDEIGVRTLFVSVNGVTRTSHGFYLWVCIFRKVVVFWVLLLEN